MTYANSVTRFVKEAHVRLDGSPLPLVLDAAAWSYPKGRHFVFNGLLYDVREAACYKLVQPGIHTQNLVVGDTSLELCAGFCKLHTYGHADDPQPTESPATALARQKSILASGTVELTCAAQTAMMQAVLSSRGLASRVIRFVTLQDQNGYNDGHVSLEIQEAGEWACVDLSNHCAFRDGTGRLLKTKEIPAAVIASTSVCDWLAAPELAENHMVDGTTANPSWDFTAMFQEFGDGKEGAQAWHRRTLSGAVGWDHPSGETWWVFPEGTAQSKVDSVIGLSPVLWKQKSMDQVNAYFYA